MNRKQRRSTSALARQQLEWMELHWRMRCGGPDGYLKTFADYVYFVCSPSLASEIMRQHRRAQRKRHGGPEPMRRKHA